MKVFEVCLTNYCNFKCTYCISDSSRGSDKFSEPLKLDSNGNLLLHDRVLSDTEVSKRENILLTQGQSALDDYVESEHNKWILTRDAKHDYTDWLDFNTLTAYIKEHLSSEWIINLTGGEPLYYPGICDLVGELVKTNKVMITTNGSFIRKLEQLKTFDRESVYFRIGYHPEFRNIDTFIETMEYVIDNGFKYIINYVLHPSYYEDSTKYVDHLKILDDNGFKYEITPFEGKYNGLSYPRDIFNMTPIERSLFANSSQFEFMNLKMGESFLICEPNGLVYECQGKSKQLGSLYDNTLNLEKIFHGRCMAFKGCATASSANRYIKNVMNLPGLA